MWRLYISVHSTIRAVGVTKTPRGSHQFHIQQHSKKMSRSLHIDYSVAIINGNVSLLTLKNNLHLFYNAKSQIYNV
jgi:hypothetical protein